MRPEGKRAFKDEIYEQFSRIGKAFSSPRRLELVDLLAQGDRTVEELAEATGMSVANTSRHLQVLRRARLVRRRKQGTYAHYDLAGPQVLEAWRKVRSLAEARLAEIEDTVERYLSDRGEFEAVSAEELAARLDDDGVVVLDVRPAREYRAGHIAGARSVPLDELEERIDELPHDDEVVAYCRGPYCVFSDEAVRRLRDRGIRARRLEGGLPDWAAEGRPVETGPGDSGADGESPS